MPILEITCSIGCPNRCDYCPQALLLSRYKGCPVLWLGPFMEVIEKLPKNVVINFAGFSEPLDSAMSMELVCQAHKRGFRVSMFTTLIGIWYGDFHLLGKIPWKDFCLHLPDAEDHMKYTVGEEYLMCLERVLAMNIKNMSMMSMGPIHPKIKERFGIETNGGGLHSRAGNLKRKDVKHVYNKGKLRCGGGDLDANVMMPNGDVYICCMDYGLKYKMGNLRDSAYETLFQSEAYKTMKAGLEDESLDTLCRYCAEAICVT